MNKKVFILTLLVFAGVLLFCGCNTEPAHIHNYGEWFISQKPTCTESGLQFRYCSCGEMQTQTIPPAHNEVAGEMVRPTCTESGLTGGSHCSICGAEITPRELIAPTGHTKETISGYPATCTSTGLTDGTRCAVCGVIIDPQREIPVAHVIVKDPGVAATCTKTGLTEGSHCSVCGTVITAQTEIPKIAHTAVTDPGVAATCTKTGLTEGSHCSVCGTVITAQRETAKTAHTAVKDPGVAATCTKTGLTEGSHCSVCGTIITAQKEIAKTAHKSVKDPGVAATCTKTGLTEGSHCSVCGTIITAQKEIAKTAHKSVKDPGVAATCTKTGLTEGSHCSVCGTVITAQKTINALGHSYGSDGKCTRCGSSDPSLILISSADDLRNVSSKMDGKYLLTRDIDLTNTPWTSLGSEAVQFTGVFDGGGHTIRFRKVTMTSENALFYTNSGTIKNLKIDAKGVEMANSDYRGAYFAITNNGTIENCTITGERTYSFSSEKSSAGTDPKSGEANYGHRDFLNCSFVFGEFCCQNNGTIKSCKNSGSVSITHNVYAAQWAHHYGLAFHVFDTSTDYCEVTSNIDFGGICVENNKTIQQCDLESTYYCVEKVKTATQYSQLGYAYVKANIKVVAGSVCASNNGKIDGIKARTLKCDSYSHTKWGSDPNGHETVSFNFAECTQATGLIGQMGGSAEVKNISYK